MVKLISSSTLSDLFFCLLFLLVEGQGVSTKLICSIVDILYYICHVARHIMYILNMHNGS